MRKYFSMVIVVASVAFPYVVGATTAPAKSDVVVSKCITATSKAKHATAIAKFEKDIAAYDTSVNGAAIEKYRNALEVAWAAMNDEYCGYGAYGAASAIKSYGKSVERARVAFLAEVKGPKKNEEKKVEKKAEAKQPKPSEKAKEVASPKARFKAGWRRGMRHESIKELQQFLAEYFKMKADDSIVTGFFGPKTEGLVKKYQLEKKIIKTEDDPGAGLIGPRTTAALNDEE